MRKESRKDPSLSIPSRADFFWRELMEKIVKESITSIESSGKQLIVIISGLQGLYLAIISFTRVIEEYSAAAKFLFLSPMILWMISLLYGILIFFPKPYEADLGSPDSAEETYRLIASRKHRYLKRSYILLFLSLCLIVVNIVIYVFRIWS